MHHVTDDITLFQQHNIMHNAVWDLAMQGVADLHFEGTRTIVNQLYMIRIHKSRSRLDRLP